MDEQESGHKDLHGINLEIIGIVSLLNWVIDFLPFDNIINLFSSSALIFAVLHLHTKRARSIGIKGMLLSTLIGLIPIIEWIPAEFITRHLIKREVRRTAEER